ncbi:pyridoxamine 5'-phosphate oxidase [Peniophora sp. CONT]|nr:pyridoxamine 5'-phosphate oxidase [Peniophora sp. CONT]
MDVIIPKPPGKTEVLTSSDKIQVTDHKQYQAPENLTTDSVLPNPLDQFRAWFTAAQPVVAEPEAMSVSTVSADGTPSARVVLLKQADETGFVFYTNYESRKSRELSATGKAALAFYWREVHKQVRVVGRVEKVSEKESDDYYRSRPVGSRLGAWASAQSTVIGEGDLDKRLADVKEKFGVKGEEPADVPRPDFWGGWRIVPDEVEFWLGKPSRLHDRVRYLRKEGANEWTIEKLSP